MSNTITLSGSKIMIVSEDTVKVDGIVNYVNLAKLDELIVDGSLSIAPSYNNETLPLPINLSVTGDLDLTEGHHRGFALNRGNGSWNIGGSMHVTEGEFGVFGALTPNDLRVTVQGDLTIMMDSPDPDNVATLQRVPPSLNVKGTIRDDSGRELKASPIGNAPLPWTMAIDDAEEKPEEYTSVSFAIGYDEADQNTYAVFSANKADSSDPVVPDAEVLYTQFEISRWLELTKTDKEGKFNLILPSYKSMEDAQNMLSQCNLTEDVSLLDQYGLKVDPTLVVTDEPEDTASVWLVRDSLNGSHYAFGHEPTQAELDKINDQSWAMVITKLPLQ